MCLEMVVTEEVECKAYIDFNNLTFFSGRAGAWGLA